MASLNEFTQPLGLERAAHLLRRTTFGPTPAQIDSFSTLTASEAMTTLFADETLPIPPIDTATGESWVNPPAINRAVDGVNSEQTTLREYFKAWHTDVMFKSGLSIKERMTWFFHSHLPARWTRINSSEAIYYQNCLYRHYALGSFKELFKKICVDNAMLLYLDGYTNHKDSPNENFAREMFELYSIGKGPQLSVGNYTNYTEVDVKAATKVLTGWINDEDFNNIDTDTNLPTGILIVEDEAANPQVTTAHDSSTKTFSSLFSSATISPSELSGGNATYDAAYQELDDLIEMIFAKKETARFIMRKLYRQFVYHFISDEVEADIIDPLAQDLLDNGYILADVLQRLFKSQHFYDADDAVSSNNSIGALIKSPVELSLGLLRFFEVELPDRDTQTTDFYTDMLEGIVNYFDEQGLHYYEPFEVAGYPAYHQFPAYGRNWIMAIELASRYQIGRRFMSGDTEPFSFRIDIVDWVQNSGHISDPSDATEIVTFLTQYLLPLDVTTLDVEGSDRTRFDYFLYDNFIGEDGELYQWTNLWNAYIGGDPDTGVRLRLENLLAGIIESPEFQLN